MAKKPRAAQFRDQPEQPRYNVVSIRVSDEEKAILCEMSKRHKTNITNVMRMAFYSYICLGQR